MSAPRRVVFSLCFLSFTIAAGAADAPPIVPGVDPQPLKAQVARVAQALETLGTPLTAAQRDAVDKAAALPEGRESAAALQEALDPLCLAVVTINPESRVKVAEGPAAKELVQDGWRAVLVKVINEAGVAAAPRVQRPDAAPGYKRSSGRPD